MMFIKDHQPLLMCSKCYGLLRDDMSEYYTHNFDNNITLCNCKEKDRCNAIKVDKNVFEIVQRLNQKGYITTGSCEGHGKQSISIGYKNIGNTKKIDKSNLPEGFNLYAVGILGYKRYNCLSEKRADYKKLLNWIENDLKERNND